MARFELKLPKMGESVAEATITSWLKEVGDLVELDEAVVEIATDKVDSEVPSEVEGTLVEVLFEKDTVVAVGETIAIIETDKVSIPNKVEPVVAKEVSTPEVVEVEKTIEKAVETVATPIAKSSDSGKFYSPLVRNIAQTEGVSMDELETIVGTGQDGRVTKSDILSYIENKGNKTPKPAPVAVSKPVEVPVQQKEVAIVEKPKKQKQVKKAAPVSLNGGDEIIEMSRMGKLIAKHMVDSVQTSAHVQSFIEIDVTNIVKWRNKVKDAFLEREGEKLTFTPILMQAIALTIKKYPLINIAVDGDKIIKKKNINLGMAAALPDGNLIVPVIKNADQLNLVGMTSAVNDLANRARNNALKPDEVQDGTYTVTNVGSFGSVMGTPIINQPQVAILALGAIRKVPAVIETSEGDYVGIRQKMFVSHSYDHRVVNGALGGMFIKTLKEILEAWDVNREF
ncbi:diapophytoene dehydrogenase [Polaribacter reichenbachii]|uniref:Dihydrolipoamide acetyltransferase component of pyruvate dehydrogenase complex n=1 Tax=Polaribacter reichenbachii TaxID=996801 RepID=A0A1B8TQM7_9FLAO|nr:dihydrolipoamide acetyltransferase family protein [Polaribacter reichenbachii]APZ46703.1 diapophytoene dehydrogenase [Polaribacter reichenbachii]AUC17346.1 diapophytoene dehydrogenase [Polaribacter reichenbachii]OBY61778.1 diapophytoene dehydrogenase [Polaribacter reichenbachii]